MGILLYSSLWVMQDLYHQPVSLRGLAVSGGLCLDPKTILNPQNPSNPSPCHEIPGSEAQHKPDEISKPRAPNPRKKSF